MWSIMTGGQTGVDTGALMAARDLGIPWRAYFPNGWRREKPIPDWMWEHALELGRYGYDERTRYCVRLAADAKGTLLLVGEELGTPGTKLTRQLADHYGLPILGSFGGLLKPNGLLMVAGPRGSKWKDGAACAYKIVKALFQT